MLGSEDYSKNSLQSSSCLFVLAALCKKVFVCRLVVLFLVFYFTEVTLSTTGLASILKQLFLSIRLHEDRLLTMSSECVTMKT